MSKINFKKSFKNIKSALLKKYPDAKLSCNFKKGKNNDPDWHGIVVSKILHINLAGKRKYKATIALYPMNNGGYCLDNSNIPGNIYYRYNDSTTFANSVRDTLMNLNPRGSYKLDENVFMRIINSKNINKTVKAIEEYFQFAKDELITALVLSHSKYQQNAEWTNSMASYGQYLNGKDFSSANSMLSASTANCFSTPSTANEKHNKKFYNSLYSNKSKELKYKVKNLSLESSNNSSFSKSFYSECAEVGSYRSHFISLLDQNANASSFTSASESMHNQMENYEDIYWNSNNSAKSSASSKENKLGNKIEKYNSSILHSMESSAKNSNKK